MRAVVYAMHCVSKMTVKQKLKRIDEIYVRQPNMLASVLVQKQLGVSLAKMDFLIELLLFCDIAMMHARPDWPVISEDDQDLQLSLYAASVKHAESLPVALRERAIAQYINTHPEKCLLAYVQNEINNWAARVEPEESDTKLMLAAMTFVNRIAYVELPPIG